ncbi:peptidoglycan-binding domain-containing protein [Streptomyces minutiscleroticus]|uniref:Peptidoglycan binding-like domain-containing protein n=1 Tax=Streptomyces minutiscleroticus TaxID=68238 RepID=A0A918U3M5_9ACTN|nr:peptidoglycan-binding domain-containing protein [Streptomyces minutiscleroticus]GGX88242.1 hypothetical protein GCM10010358_47910 [Streptomyces minutiscleroticus]
MPTPSEPAEPTRRPALEPTHVLRPRRRETLADLLRRGGEARERGADEHYEVVRIPPAPPDDADDADEDTEETAPAVAGAGPSPHVVVGRAEAWPSAGVAPGRRSRRSRRSTRWPEAAGFGRLLRSLAEPPRGAGRQRPSGHARRTGRAGPRAHAGAEAHPPWFRRTAVGIALAAAVVAGFGLALLLVRGQPADAAHGRAPAVPAPSATASGAAVPDPDGAGTLRQGDSGAPVRELQERLLNIPEVYRGGSVSGTYDAALTAAVARFQLWYGVRGDEAGVYGDDTRLALESRTVPVPGAAATATGLPYAGARERPDAARRSAQQPHR